MQETPDARSSTPGPKTKPFLRKALLVVAALIVGIAVCVPFFFSRHTLGNSDNEGIRVIQTHDLGNLLAMMEQYDKVLRSGVIYPRWTPEWNMGYGTATFNFYPPCLFYLTTLVHAVLIDWVDTVFVISAMALAASGLAFYFLSITFYSRLASSIAALVYMVLPFHQMDLYWRGGITQFVGYVFLPLVIYFAFKLGSEGGARYYAAFGLAHGFYILTHLPVSYIFTYVLAVYAVIWSAREKDLRILMRLAGGMTLALLLSAIYWMPAALEARHAYEWVTETFPYHHQYISLSPVGDSFSQLIQNIFTFHAIALITVIVVLRKTALPATVETVENDKTAGRAESQTRLWVILGVATLFMTTSFSIYVSKLIPKIQVAVPPFRWLAIASLFLALLVAACVDRLRVRQESSPRLLVVCRIALGVAIALNLWLTVQGVIIRALSHPTFVVANQFGDSGCIPLGATLPHLLPDTAPVMVEPEGGHSEVIEWLPTQRTIAVRVDQPSQMRIKTYNFYGWTARIDGNKVPLVSDKDGVQLVDVPPGIHTIHTSFDTTPPRTAGTVISVLGGLAILGLSLAGKWRERKVKGEAMNKESVAEGSFNETPAAAFSVSSSRMPRSPLKRVAAIGLVIVVGAAIVLLATRRSPGGKTGGLGNPGSTSSSRPDQPFPGGSRGVGSDAQLYIAGRDSVMVAVDEKSSEEMVSALSNRNQPALDALIGSGRVLNADNNTRVRILETMSGRTKVRILEGPHIMAEGFVLERWIR